MNRKMVRVVAAIAILGAASGCGGNGDISNPAAASAVIVLGDEPQVFAVNKQTGEPAVVEVKNVNGAVISFRGSN